MDKTKYIASAPGSLMLFGEHAVLHGKQAIVAAVNKRINVILTPRSDRVVNIYSDKLGQISLFLDSLEVQKPFQFVIGAIKHFNSNVNAINFGFDINIESEFSESIGLGSSSAVTVATLKVLYDYCLSQPNDLTNLFFVSRKVIREVQGNGSGADVAASVFGGIIAYKMSPYSVEKISEHIPLVVVYSGSKMPTREVIEVVASLHKKHPDVLSKIFAAMDNCSNDAIIALKNNDLRKVGELMNIHQGLQEAIGVNSAILSELIFALRENRNIFGAKISGSGLGDCVIGLGEILLRHFPRNQNEQKLGVQQIDVAISCMGVS